jgi:carboxyl-terminal processing protease
LLKCENVRLLGDDFVLSVQRGIRHFFINMRLVTLLLLVLQMGLFQRGAAGAAADSVDKTLLARPGTNGTALTAGPNDPIIARVTARMLERQHYLRKPLNDEVSLRFLERYLDMLDGRHMYFLQSDLRQFDKYTNKLDELTLVEGDTSPARVIFTRFLERLQQQYDYVTELLEKEKFDFTTDERVLVNRKDAPRPRDLDEAKKLWRDLVRYEYLQEKLGVGRPEEIAKIVREKLDENRPDAIAKAIEDKLSKEKAETIAKIVEENFGQKKAGEVAQIVLEKLNKDNAGEIVKTISRRYTRVLKMLREFDNDDVLQYYLTALCHVYDPHSDYMGKSELENFAIGMKLSLFGIGALLQSEDGMCKIRELKPGPAQRSGKVKPGDKIVGVAQGEADPVDVVDMPLKKVVDLIRGPKDTEVRLTVIPADAADPSVRKVVSLVREEIRLEDQEAKAKVVEYSLGTKEDADGVIRTNTMRLGVIDLPSFYSSFELAGRKNDEANKSTTTDCARLIRKLVQENVAGIVLDLRHNGGGSLEEAITLTGLFIKEGTVVQVRDWDGERKQHNDPEPSVFYDGPLVVLTSRFSASASEILAGALQDFGRAVIVGDSSTHGKGTVQSLIQLENVLRGQSGLVPNSNPGAVKITIRKFYRPGGSSTQLKGVVPDIVLPSINNELEVGEASLDNPLPWDTIEPAKFQKSDRLTALLPELKKRSETRVAADSDFAFVRDEVQRYKKSVADKTVSLNEAQRVKEKEEADQRSKNRKKELAARPPSPEIVYEVKLKDVETPGLPAPEKKTNNVTSASGSTNATLVAKSADENESAEDTVNAPDIPLQEGKQILLDLVNLSLKQNAVAATLPRKAVTDDKHGSEPTAVK